jgi:hypothetical protein
MLGHGRAIHRPAGHCGFCTSEPEVLEVKLFTANRVVVSDAVVVYLK